MKPQEFPLTQDLEDIVPHGDLSFPMEVYTIKLSTSLDRQTDLHWHHHFQFVLVTKGEAVFIINNKKNTIQAGEGIFINSQVLHTIYVTNRKGCEYQCFNIAPDFFVREENIIYSKYLQPLIDSEDVYKIILKTTENWQKQILKLLETLYNAYFEKGFMRELEAYCLLHKILFILVSSVSEDLENHSPKRNGDSHKVKKVIEFMEKEYQRKISLQEIADYISVSKSSCCRLFKEETGYTPFEFLAIYRIDRSKELLRQFELNITEISLEVGFSGVSYYIEQFKKITGHTPNHFRKIYKSKKIVVT